MHERGIVNLMETHADSSEYSILGFGSGANIALYYIKEMMMNDTTTALKSLVLVNPFISVDSNMVASLSHVMQAADNKEQLLLETLLHAKNVKKGGETKLTGFKWPVSNKDR